MAETDVDREEKEAAVREVFLNHATLLRVPCHLICTVPSFMIQHSQDLGARYGGMVFIPMVRIRHRDSHDVDEAGVAAVLRALNLRVPLAEAFADPAVARDFVLKSGGYLRDLFRFMREALLLCPDQEERISVDVGREAVRLVQRDYRLGLFEEYKHPLQQTRRTNAFPLGKDTSGLFGDLLRAHMLMWYENQDEWFDVHPLVWDLLPPGPSEDAKS